MMNSLKLFITIIILFFASNIVNAQVSKLEGTWELAKNLLPGEPFYSIIRTIDAEGNYTQIKVTAEGTFVVQKAKFDMLNEKEIKEHISYSLSPNNKGKVYTLVYSLFESVNTDKMLMIQGGTKVVDGEETADWREFWRKVETIE